MSCGQPSEAAGRLAYLADDHMLGCADLLGDLRRDLQPDPLVATLAALGVALLALALSSAGVWALFAWRQDRRAVDALAERLDVDSRLEALTVQTLSAMREAVRRAGDRR